MSLGADVRSAAGVPLIADFASATGTPLVVDKDTGFIYSVKTGDTVVGAGLGGTVTSVALSAPSGVLGVSGSPITTSGTLTLAWSGTSGGTPYFNAANTMASSAALGSTQVVLGGGAGGAPNTSANLTFNGSKLTHAGGTLSADTQAYVLTATQPTTPTAAQNAVSWTITSAGSAAQNNRGFLVTYAAGYTGSNLSAGIASLNGVAGTGATLIPAAGSNSFVGNVGAFANATGSTVGYNAGFNGSAANGNINVGFLGVAQVAKNSATNIGVVGSAINTGTTPVQIGGYFTLNNTTAPAISAALIADNGSQTSDIFVARDNGSVVHTISDGGRSFFGGLTAPTAWVHLAAGTTAASTGPFKFTVSGAALLTAPEVGVLEPLTDDLYYTLTTGTARKRLLMADPVGGLTSGRVPFAATNGRLTDDADFAFATDTLTVTKIAATTFSAGFTMADAQNVVLNATTGTKWGTATTQKQAWYGVTPVTQATGIADADGTLADITTKFNSLLGKLEAYGLLAVA